MLSIGNQDCGSIQIELLDGVVCSQRKQAGSWSVDSQPSNVLESRDAVKRDMFGANIPRHGLTEIMTSQ